MLRVLIVDDEKPDRAMIRAFLSRLEGAPGPCVVTEACGMIDGLAVLRRTNPDCIILDQHMPDGDGLTFLRRAETVFPHAAMRVVLVTGCESVETAVEAMKLGASDYLAKDQITSTTLLQAVERTVERADLNRRWRHAEEEHRTFAHTAAHDLKAPLRQIGQFSELLQLRFGDRLGPDGERYLVRIRETTQRMHQLVQGLLDYATVTDDGIEPVRLLLDEVVEEALALLQEQVEAAAATVRVDEGLGEAVGYGHLLGRVVQNLVANAIKFSGEEPPQIWISVERDQEGLRLTVTDNGIGIPSEDMVRIFEPFTRLHGRASYEGTGLGLATCRRVAELHQGRLEVSSKVGEGSRFTLHLPPSCIVESADVTKG